jgi:N utilization substance protein B
MARGEHRSAARLAAVQALYQMDVAGTGVEQILREFEAHWIGREVDGDTYKPAEIAFFKSVVDGVLTHQGEIDREIDAMLADGWPLARVEAVMRAVLRAGLFELRHRTDVPARVVVSEYVDVASAFFAKEEAGMTNAVLDALARTRRPLEFSGNDSVLEQ